MFACRPLRRASLLVLAVITGVLGYAGPAAAAPPGQGPGGPVLVITDPGDRFGRYYAEILTAEGLNAFEVRDLGQVSAATLAAHSTAIVAPMALSSAQVAMLSNWVASGGNLIAMRPRTALAGLAGLGADVGDLSDGYVAVNTRTAPGAGITGATMQFHGTADRWTQAGAAQVAALYTGPGASAGAPAVTLRSVGSAGGQVATFAFDLARSVVYTRQGNPAGPAAPQNPTRAHDFFLPNWLNLDKVGIPQADEQQRLLANLITRMSGDRIPLPRFWYFPRGERAVVVMTGDDHHPVGTATHFDRFLQLSPAGCSVADWGCVRSSSYVYAEASSLTDAQVAAYESQGFEVALHLNTGCSNYTAQTLRADWMAQRQQFLARWPGVARPPVTNRTHCIAWSDWATQPVVERDFGVRLDTNYYYWPPSWNQNRPGLFTGSGIPMRFAGTDGSLIDVYQAPTQLVDEADATNPPNDIPLHIAALLDRALGPAGYYGAFTANIHTDRSVDPAVAIVQAAQARGVPVVSARQLLGWLDGRNGSAFTGLTYDGANLRFGIQQAAGARGLEAMVPVAGPSGRLRAVSRGGAPVAITNRVVKGIEYAVFPGVAGRYVAAYPAAPVTVTAGSPSRDRDRTAPRIKVRPLRVRMGERGFIKLRLTCPRRERLCRVDLQLRRRGRTVGRVRTRVRGVKTRTVRLRIRAKPRAKIVERGSLRVVARAAARDVAGNRAVTVTRIKILAPRAR
jgi:hypothetical protein